MLQRIAVLEAQCNNLVREATSEISRESFCSASARTLLTRVNSLEGACRGWVKGGTALS